jgi:hypothetical protein
MDETPPGARAFRSGATFLAPPALFLVGDTSLVRYRMLLSGRAAA